MDAPAPPDLLLFVSGEPGPGADPDHTAVSSISQRLTGMILPPLLLQSKHLSGRRSTEGGPVWHLSREGTVCVNLVIDVARREGRRVTLVNVNEPGADEPLVRRWVDPEDILPVLIRPDGGRLNGIEEFTPENLRRFLRGDRK